jgi:hypothetical protein
MNRARHAAYLHLAEAFASYHAHRSLALDVRCFINNRTVLTVRSRAAAE